MMGASTATDHRSELSAPPTPSVAFNSFVSENVPDREQGDQPGKHEETVHRVNPAKLHLVQLVKVAQVNAILLILGRARASSATAPRANRLASIAASASTPESSREIGFEPATSGL
jgi:hypothetical protein